MHTDLAYAKPVRFFDKILDIPKYVLVRYFSTYLPSVSV